MNASIRPAETPDIPQMIALLMAEAERREAVNPAIWPLAEAAPDRIESFIRTGLESDDGQFWQVAEASGALVGVCHAMMLPVPPIYKGALGVPGLILDDFLTSASAPVGTAAQLLAGTESALRDAGADCLLASSAAQAPIGAVLEQNAYETITLFMGKGGFDATGDNARGDRSGVRRATCDDVPGIVAASARNRQMLAVLHPFWTPHEAADTRFDGWMRRSLTFSDRALFVTGDENDVNGYIIAQPIADLLVPAAHCLHSIGVIDDFYDVGFAEIKGPADTGSTAGNLLLAAEAFFSGANFKAAMAVCPRAWQSKKALLEAHGYHTAKQWLLKN